MRRTFTGLIATASLAVGLVGCSSANSAAGTDLTQTSSAQPTDPFVEVPRSTGQDTRTKDVTAENAAMKLGAAWSCAARDVESVEHTYGLRPDLLGLTLADVRQDAKEHQTGLRVLGEDGDCADRTLDLRHNRVNIYLRDNRVVWAATF